MDLFKKTNIGKIEVRNHFVRSSTYEGKATKAGYPTEDIKAIYTNLADGGVGTIMTSYTFVTDYEQPAKNQLGIYSDKMIPEYRELTDEVHNHGAKIIMQIAHGSSHSQAYAETAKILGPSAVTHPVSGITPREMTLEEIDDVVGRFASAARRVKASGFDGVQIHCAHGYLLSQFISPIYNVRTDEYGGSVENRMRMILRVYSAVRREVGEDYPIWVKINSSDEQEGGLTVDEFIEMGKLLEAAGIDAIEISGMRWKFHEASDRLYYKGAAVRLAEAVNVPVILTGGIRTAEDIMQVYGNSKVEFFGFARPFLEDSAFLLSLKKQFE